MMEAKILSILRNADSPVSGEVMGADMGVSRVAIFKQIEKLRKLGYAIHSASGGYRLARSPDALYPWEFPNRESRIHYFEKIASTMDAARNLARSGCPPFTVAAADIQTQGRGRLDRTWLSERGGLYFTLVTRPLLAPENGHQVLFTASVILANLLKDRFSIDARLKWPNDILAGGKKIAGMLSEMEADADRVSYVNIGIGINVNNTVRIPGIEAMSIKSLLGKTVSRRDILTDFLDAMEVGLTGTPFSEVLDQWKALSETLSRQVRIVTLRETVEGIAEDLDETGALILRQKSGERKRIVYGDCFHA